MSDPRPIALVVDDDPPIRKMVKAMLEAQGFEVHEAPDGRTAIKHIDACRPDFVCLDLMLPETSGYDVLDHLKAKGWIDDTPVLMMSARGLPEDRAQAEELGARAYLKKPFTHRDFREGMRRTLGDGLPKRRSP